MALSRVQLFALLALLGALLFAASPTSAEESLRAKGDRLCKYDARRLCRTVLAEGDFAVLGCFQQKKTRLSAPCRKFLIGIGQLN